MAESEFFHDLESADPIFLIKQGQKVTHEDKDYRQALYYYQQAQHALTAIQEQLSQKINPTTLDEKTKAEQRGNEYRREGNYEMMLSQYKKAIDLGSVNALILVSEYYQSVGNYDMMKFYLQQAISYKNISAMIRLGNYYRDVENNLDLMRLYYSNAIEHGDIKVIVNLENFGTLNEDFS